MRKKIIYVLSFSLLNFGCVKKNDGLQSSSPIPNIGGRQSDRDQKQGLVLARELDRMAHSVAQSQLSLKLAMQLVPTLKEKYLPVNEKYVQRMSDEELADAFEKLQSYSVLYAKQKIASSVMDEFIYLKKNASSVEKAKELYFDFSLPFSSGDFSGSDFGSVQQMQITLAEEMLNRQIEKVRNIYLDSLSKEMDIVIEDALVTMDRGAYQNAARDAGDDEKWEKSELKSLVYEEIDKKLGSLPELFKATLIDHAKEKVQRFLQDHPQLNNKLSDAIAFAGAISKIRTMGKVFEDFDQRRITAAQSISVVGKSIASGLEIVGKEIHDQIQSLDDGQSNIDVAKKGLDSVDEFYRFLKGEIPDPKSKYGAYELSKAYEKAQKDTDQLGQSMSDLATASEDFVVAAERLGIDKDLAKDARKVINALSIGGQFLRNLADNGPLSAVTVAAATVVGAGIPDIATTRHEELLAEFKELRAMSQEMLQLQRKTLESIVALSKQINLQYSNLLVKLDSIEYSVDRANSMLASNEVRILDSCYRRMAYGTRSQTFDKQAVEKIFSSSTIFQKTVGLFEKESYCSDLSLELLNRESLGRYMTSNEDLGGLRQPEIDMYIYQPMIRLERLLGPLPYGLNLRGFFSPNQGFTQTTGIPRFGLIAPSRLISLVDHGVYLGQRRTDLYPSFDRFMSNPNSIEKVVLPSLYAFPLIESQKTNFKLGDQGIEIGSPYEPQAFLDDSLWIVQSAIRQQSFVSGVTIIPSLYGHLEEIFQKKGELEQAGKLQEFLVRCHESKTIAELGLCQLNINAIFRKNMTLYIVERVLMENSVKSGLSPENQNWSSVTGNYPDVIAAIGQLSLGSSDKEKSQLTPEQKIERVRRMLRDARVQFETPNLTNEAKGLAEALPLRFSDNGQIAIDFGQARQELPTVEEYSSMKAAYPLAMKDLLVLQKQVLQEKFLESGLMKEVLTEKGDGILSEVTHYLQKAIGNNQDEEKKFKFVRAILETQLAHH